MKIEKVDYLYQDIIDFFGDVLDGYEKFYEIQISNNLAELWQVDSGESYAITRLERDDWKNRTVLVVCCFAGKNIRQFSRHVIAIAEAKGWDIRMHTKNETIAKLMKRNYQFGPAEMVLTREVK